MRRLVLGLILIALTSSVLLLSDWSQRQPAGGQIPRVAIVQHASQKILDEGVQGMLDALADGGLVDGRTLRVERFNAQNDQPTANSIASQVVEQGVDLILTASTLSLQTVAAANRDGRTKHVFGLVSNPSGAGVGISATDPLDHPKHLAGIGTMQPVTEAFRLAKTLLPGLKTIGVAWNPTEANSEACTLLARKVSQELGIPLLEANVENSSGVSEAASSLVSRGAQALWIGGDLTVLVATDAVLAAAARGRIPVFSNIPGTVERGALFDLGANYYELGRLVGAMAVQVLRGAVPATIPIRNIVPQKLAVNRQILRGLKDPWQLPDDLVAKADAVLGENGKLESKTAAAAQRPLSKKWKLYFFQLNNTLDVEESEQGMREGLQESGLVEGRDYEVKVTNAQGDMSGLSGQLDAALTDRADMLIVFSSPTLQVAVQKVKRIPIVFTYVSNGVLAGAGRSNQDHVPNVTGVSAVGGYDEALPVIRECLPGVKRIGTLFVPAEVNMVYNKEVLEQAAAKAGLELVAVPASTATEVADAALALMSRRIDALVQIPGNLTAAAFGGIAEAARKARVPVFAFQRSQALTGAAVVFSRDYHDWSKQAAGLAVRIMRGEDPARIPLEDFTKTKLVINPAAAHGAGLRIPGSLLARAGEVIGN